MKNGITVTLHLSPLASRIIERDFAKERYGYDVSKSYIYDIIKSQLCRTPQTPSIGDDYTEKSIFITQKDFFVYGCHIKADGHKAISHIIEKMTRIEICNFVAVATASGAKRDTAIKHYLFENDIDEQLNFHAVKKYYQRNCMQLENMYRQLFAEMKKKENQKRTIDVNF